MKKQPQKTKSTAIIKQERVNSAVVKNKDQLQSYILTTAKYDFTVYEKRILYRLVEIAQAQIEGLKFMTDCRRIEHTLYDTVYVTLPVSSLLADEDDENYTRVKKALKTLQSKIFTYENNGDWESISIIALPKIKNYSSTVSFQVDNHVWDCILDFTKGFRKYELTTAMKFKSVYSMRFYELLSGQKSKITYSVDELKEMFCVQNRYERINDFVRKVIEPAKKELDSHSPYSFEWSVNKEGKKITSFNFYPIFKPEHRDVELEKRDLQRKTSLSWDLNRQVMDYLISSIGFTRTEINNNRDLIIMAQNRVPDILNELSILKAKSRDKNNPKGWIINALKGKLLENKNIH